MFESPVALLSYIRSPAPPAASARMNWKPLILVMLVGVCTARPAIAADAITVGAAASMKEALTEVAAAYKADTGGEVDLTFGSSGQLMAQIKNGAPIDLFISAAVKQVDELAKEKLVDGGSVRNVASNELVLIVPAGAKAAPASFKDLADSAHKRIATGDPKTVPAGEYAAQALETLKLTGAVGDRLVYGASVRQVLDYVERGEVAAGIVYRTDALQSGDKVKVVDRADPITHAPIVYPGVVVTASKKAAAARQFLDYLVGAKARKILAAKGFGPPPASAAVSEPAP
jgi:molybdate transport system substrate-binding protein